MLCVERQPGASCARHEAWWKAVTQRAAGTVFDPYVKNLAMVGNRWLVLDAGFLQGWEFFSSIPGWEGADGFGKPLTVRKLTVSEEHYATRNAPASEKATFVDHCMCPPDLPRRVRREADRASQKLIKKAIQKAARQQ